MKRIEINQDYRIRPTLSKISQDEFSFAWNSRSGTSLQACLN